MPKAYRKNTAAPRIRKRTVTFVSARVIAMDLNKKVGNVKLSVLLVGIATSLLCATMMSIVEVFIIMPTIYRFLLWMCMWVPISLALSKCYDIYIRKKSSI
jgi:hypothetical protein